MGTTLKEIRDNYKDDVRIIFKHRPLSFHKRATPAAIASMAANNQGKFWQYHDKLFEDTKKLEDSDLEQYAKDLGLDMEKFKADIADPKLADIVKKHDAQCVAIGASGTPAFFVNGRYMSGAVPFDQFKPVIDEELKKARKMVADGVAKAEVYNQILAEGKKRPGGALDSKVHKFDVRQSPTDGPNTAVATLVVFSDFQ